MKSITRASRAPGVASVGMICAAIASTSAAWAGVKNANARGWPDRAACCTKADASSMPSALAASHAPLTPASVSNRNSRRDRS